MKVILLTSPASIKDMENFAALAALTCHANTDKKTFIPEAVLRGILRLGHESILEHITLTYSVKGLSRACLQELARHRHISLSVESTRHTLRKIFSDKEMFIERINQVRDLVPCEVLINLSDVLKSFRVDLGQKVMAQLAPFMLAIMEYMTSMGKQVDSNGEKIENTNCPDDMLKYYLPEFWPTNLILTSNIRELRHILTLRTNPAALNEFRVLAYSLYEAVPEDYRYLLKDCVYREDKNAVHESKEN